jgi:hypothetical protein
VTRLFSFVATLTRDPKCRELFRWCLPALVCGLILRVVLTAQMPHGFFHDDTPDFLTTAEKMILKREWELHEKKTFLVPVLFAASFALQVPAIITIPIGQHLLGLALILVVGALCRLWLDRWKVFVIPLTLLTAANPFMLWYERTLMAETTFVFCTVLVALMGTLYVRKPTLRRFAWFAISLVLEAGSRPEGKLLFGFGFFLVLLVHGRELRTMWLRPAMMSVLALVVHSMTKTSQAGLLLFTSVARLAPADLKAAPGIDPYFSPIRTSLEERWAKGPYFPKVRDRRAIASAVKSYLEDKKLPRSGDVDPLCLKLATETCLRRWYLLPGLALAKFRSTANEAPAGQFDEYWVLQKQEDALLDQFNSRKPGDTRVPVVISLSHRLFGASYTGADDLKAYLKAHFHPIGWHSAWSKAWSDVVNACRFPDLKYNHWETGQPQVYSGIPFYFLFAGLGLLALWFRPGSMWVFHFAWGWALLGFFFVIMLTANVKPRFRFVFEPFWFIYLAVLADLAWAGVRKWIRR